MEKVSSRRLSAKPIAQHKRICIFPIQIPTAAAAGAFQIICMRTQRGVNCSM